MSVVVLLLVLLLFTALYGMIMIRWGLKHLSCRRSFSCRAAFEGEQAELVEVVTNDQPLIIPWLRVESRIPADIAFGRGERPAAGQTSVYQRSVFCLMPYQRITRRHRVTFLHRGSYNLGNAALTAGDLLSLVQQSRDQAMDVPVLVYPRILEDERLPLLLARMTGDFVMERQLLRDPYLYSGIREYCPGDNVRDIHWAASARTGITQVLVHDYSAQLRLMVLLNVQKTESQWGDISADETRIVEYGISLAATVCLQALRGGMTAGFAANMPMDEQKESTVLLPEGGSVCEERLLTAMARLRIRRTAAFPTFVEQLTDVRDMDVLLLSCYDGESIRTCEDRLRERGNRVLLHILGEPRAEVTA